MIDENDKDTIHAFQSAMVHSHYNAVAPCDYYRVTGNRYAGSTTPDVVRGAWQSPPEVVAYMAERYGEYDLDAAASASNKVCEKFMSEQLNCLTRWWGCNKHVWLNPPYNNIDPFVNKAIEQMEHGNQIDMLLPADNSTAWFADAVSAAAEIIWIIADADEEYSRSGRLAFINALTGQPVSDNNKGSVLFVMRELKPGEVQKTHYVKITDICPSTLNKRKKKRGKK